MSAASRGRATEHLIQTIEHCEAPGRALFEYEHGTGPNGQRWFQVDEVTRHRYRSRARIVLEAHFEANA